MNICPNCDSSKVIRKGSYALADGTLKLRFKCNDCSTPFSVSDNVVTEQTEILTGTATYIRDDAYIKQLRSKKVLVVTAAQNNAETNLDFLAALETYVSMNDGNLMIIPIKYRTSQTKESLSYCEHIEDYLVENTVDFPKYNMRILAGLKIQATAENPLSGLDPFSKGRTLILGHAQLQLKTMPRTFEPYAPILTTTGSVSNKFYSNTKLGNKAEFNHSLSAVVIEFDDDCFHLRHLNYDEVSRGFYDLDTWYSPDGYELGTAITAIITGDEHAIFNDPAVREATYDNVDSLVNVLQPNYIVRHDVLDAFAVSHHHGKNLFTQYAKYTSGYNNVEKELDITIKYINDTTPHFAKSIIVSSNHNEHLFRWLNECNAKEEPWNAKLYHKLMYLMLEETAMGQSGAEYPDPFQLYAKDKLKDTVEFVGRTNEFFVHGINLGQHGDIGTGGSRGSATQFSKFPTKSVIGHSHSPKIEKSCYQTGTSSYMRLEYNKGPSSWAHAHVLVHANGKRQLVFIINGKWRM